MLFYLLKRKLVCNEVVQTTTRSGSAPAHTWSTFRIVGHRKRIQALNGVCVDATANRRVTARHNYNAIIGDIATAVVQA